MSENSNKGILLEDLLDQFCKFEIYFFDIEIRRICPIFFYFQVESCNFKL